MAKELDRPNINPMVHPPIVALMFIVIGLPLNSGLYWGIVLAPFYILLMNQLVIRHEEAYLTKKFGKAYTNYISRVRRWL